MIRSRGFPASVSPLFLFERDAPLKGHSAYKQAKAGDGDAALALVIDRAVAWLYEKRDRFEPGLVFIAPHAKEATGDNAIPQTLASVCAAIYQGSTDTEVVVRGGAKVVAAVAVERPEQLDAIADLHIWTAESVQNDRLDFRPRHRLTVLVVQAKPLVAPVRLPRTPDYAGCRSWVELPVTPEWGSPVHDDAALAAVAQRVRDSVG